MDPIKCSLICKIQKHPQHFKSGPGRFCQFKYADYENHRQKCPMAVCLEFVGFKV